MLPPVENAVLPGLPSWATKWCQRAKVRLMRWDATNAAASSGTSSRWQGCESCGGASEAADALLVAEFGCPVARELGLCRELFGGRDNAGRGELPAVAVAAWASALRVGVPGCWVPLEEEEAGAGLSVPESAETRELTAEMERVLGIVGVCIDMAERFPDVRAEEVRDAAAGLRDVGVLREALEVARGRALNAGQSTAEVALALCEAAGSRKRGGGHWVTASLGGRELSWLRLPTTSPGWLLLGPLVLDV